MTQSTLLTCDNCQKTATIDVALRDHWREARLGVLGAAPEVLTPAPLHYCSTDCLLADVGARMAPIDEALRGSKGRRAS